jgi:hypothetical protein
VPTLGLVEGPRRILRPRSLSLCFRLFKVRESLQKTFIGKQLQHDGFGTAGTINRERCSSARCREDAHSGHHSGWPFWLRRVPLLHSPFNTELKVNSPQHPYHLAITVAS